jgi:hypothetical protein
MTINRRGPEHPCSLLLARSEAASSPDRRRIQFLTATSSATSPVVLSRPGRTRRTADHRRRSDCRRPC